MATNFPSSLDDSTTIPVESANTKLSTNHVTAHQNIQDAIEAIETKVGANSSAVTTSHDYKLSTITGSDKAVSNNGGTLTSPIINLGSDAEGDTYYRNSSGAFTRLARGTDNHIMKMNGNVPNWEAETVTVNASTTAAGIVEEATQDEMNLGTTAGATGARLFVNPSVVVNKFIFSGDGSDGALTVTSGTTNIDLGGAAMVIKNYTSVSITSTGAVTFSNPHANGTLIIIKSQGGVTLTSSTIPNLDASGMGATAGTGGAASAGWANQTNNGGTDANSSITNYQDSTCVAEGNGAPASSLSGGSSPAAFTNQYFYTLSDVSLSSRKIVLAPGTGGGGGGGGQSQSGTASAGAAGGRGGGALVIQCGGALNFTSALGIDVSGSNGSTASDGSAIYGRQVGAGGGGGGGGSGMCLILYNTLTSATGTVNAKGGIGGAGGGVVVTGVGGGSAAGAGGGGSGGGSFTGAGGAGGSGGALAGDNNGNGGTNGTNGSGGGGGGGALAGNGVAVTLTGGGGGTSATSTALWLITKNYFH